MHPPNKEAWKTTDGPILSIKRPAYLSSGEGRHTSQFGFGSFVSQEMDRKAVTATASQPNKRDS